MRNERWSTASEIKRKFHDSTDLRCGAGPVVFAENGTRYLDDSEGHVAVYGRTGTGKSQCCSLQFVEEILSHGESAVIVDPKAELYNKCLCHVPKDYQVFCLDFESPLNSPHTWNALLDAYRLCKSNDPCDQDLGASLVSEYVDGFFPISSNTKDPFWDKAARSYVKGLVFGLFEHATSEAQINLSSVVKMMEQSETRYAMSTNIKTYYEMLPADSLARRNLSGYVAGANDTRASIHCTAEGQMEDIIARSGGLIELLSGNTINIQKLDLTRPFVVFLIIPDYTDVFSSLAGIFCSALTQNLIRAAQNMPGQKLPIRVTFILEELGSVGASIGSLKSLMVAGRSRNIRMVLILQSPQQLTDLYQKSAAETILSCVATTIAFSSNDWNFLTELSHRCGERQVEIGGHLVKEPLITPSHLYALPAGTALILKDQMKFITQLPFHYASNNAISWRPPKLPPHKRLDTIQTFDLTAFVNKQRTQRIMGASKDQAENKSPSLQDSLFGTKPKTPDIAAELQKIEEELAKLEEEEKRQKEKRTVTLYCVAVSELNGNKEKIADVLVQAGFGSHEQAMSALSKIPVEFPFTNQKNADLTVKKIVKLGGVATLIERQL